jgi:hypothetical protein
LFLLDAFAAMKRPGLRLLIVGEGPMRGPIEEKIAALGLGERVTLAGQRSDPERWLQAMDVFCLPSYANEGVPQAILQAMLCALPIVTTPVGAILEAVSDGETALVVPPRDAAALAAAIGRLLDDPALAARLGDGSAPCRQRRLFNGIHARSHGSHLPPGRIAMSQPLDWTSVSDDPNNREAKAAVRAWLKAAQRIHVDCELMDYVEAMARGRRVLDIGMAAHAMRYVDQPQWRHARIARAASHCLGIDILESLTAELGKRGFNVRCVDATSDADTRRTFRHGVRRRRGGARGQRGAPAAVRRAPPGARRAPLRRRRPIRSRASSSASSSATG